MRRSRAPALQIAAVEGCAGAQAERRCGATLKGMAMGWRRPWFGAAWVSLALASSGCFSESPTVSEMEGGDTDDVDGSSGGDTTIGDGSGDADSTGADETAGDETGAQCVSASPVIPRLDADVIIGLDPGSDVPGIDVEAAFEAGVLGWDGDPHVVILSGPGLDVDSDCPGVECGDRCPSAEVLHVVEESGLDNPLDLFVPAERYECALRLEHEGPPRVHTSFLHITDRPDEVALGSPHLSLFEDLGAIYNVACPGCAPGESNAAALIAEESFGNVVDLNEPDALAEAFYLAGSQRLDCAWPVQIPDGHTRDELAIAIEIDARAGGGIESLERVDGPAECSFDAELESLQWYFDDGSDTVLLCAGACLFLRVIPASILDVQHEFCS